MHMVNWFRWWFCGWQWGKCGDEVFNYACPCCVAGGRMRVERGAPVAAYLKEAWFHLRRGDIRKARMIIGI